MIRGDAAEGLATAALAGVSPLDYLRADEVERQVLDMVVEKAVKLQAHLQKNQAIEIANAVGKLFKR